MNGNGWNRLFVLPSVIALFCSSVLLLGSQSVAHPLAPSLLQLDEQVNGQFAVMWKTPLKRMTSGPLSPVFPPHCVATQDATQAVEGTGLVSRWSMDCGSTGLVGQVIHIEGIAGSKADVLLRLGLEDGRTFHHMIAPNEPSFQVPARQSQAGVAGEYTMLGVEHLLGGFDHVLFVIALTLLVGWGRLLLWTVTMFTLGHSVTLSLAVLGVVRFPSQPAEVLIAMSIVVVAAELTQERSQTLLRRQPWLMALLFGLLHGLGFAGALTEVGLPAGELPLALASFNVGIELGQLFLIGITVGLVRLALPHGWEWPRFVRLVPAYGIGALAASWVWQRLDLLSMLMVY